MLHGEERGGRRSEQRAAILFAAGDYARLVALEADLDGSTDPALRYRRAYAHYALGNEGAAVALARGLLDTRYADQARAILTALGRGS